VPPRRAVITRIRAHDANRGCPVPSWHRAGKTAHALYDDAVSSGFDGKDFSSLYQMFYDRSGK